MFICILIVSEMGKGTSASDMAGHPAWAWAWVWAEVVKVNVIPITFGKCKVNIEGKWGKITLFQQTFLPQNRNTYVCLFVYASSCHSVRLVLFWYKYNIIFMQEILSFLFLLQFSIFISFSYFHISIYPKAGKDKQSISIAAQCISNNQ